MLTLCRQVSKQARKEVISLREVVLVDAVVLGGVSEEEKNGSNELLSWGQSLLTSLR